MQIINSMISSVIHPVCKSIMQCQDSPQQNYIFDASNSHLSVAIDLGTRHPNSTRYLNWAAGSGPRCECIKAATFAHRNWTFISIGRRSSATASAAEISASVVILLISADPVTQRSNRRPYLWVLPLSVSTEPCWPATHATRKEAAVAFARSLPKTARIFNKHGRIAFDRRTADVSEDFWSTLVIVVVVVADWSRRRVCVCVCVLRIVSRSTLRLQP